MALHEAHREEILEGLAYVRARITALKAQERTYQLALAQLNQERTILAAGGMLWTYTATAVGTGQVFTGEVMATDGLNAVHRVNTSGILPSGQGYGVRVQRKEEDA